MSQLDPELQYQFVRSGGKGGQNVNKVATKVQLRFDLANSVLLTAAQKALLSEKLARFISQEGIFQLSSDETRSQLKNKEIVRNRFYQLIHTALIPAKKRRKTWVPRSVKEKRLKDKRIRSERKQNRKVDRW